MANVLFSGLNLKSVSVSDPEGGLAVFDSKGYDELDPTNTSLVAAVEDQNAQRVDYEGSEEALTAGTVQTATTLRVLVIRNGASASVINVRDEDGNGALVLGPITLAAGKERVIVFPTQIPATVFATGVFIDVDSGALNATPGFLIP